jgi:hypothetical protein
VSQKIKGNVTLEPEDEVDAEDMHEKRPVMFEHNNHGIPFSYKPYVPDNIKQFIPLMQEQGGSVAKHAMARLVPRSTVCEILK